MHHPTHRIAHTTAFVTPVVEHWLEREIVEKQRNRMREREREFSRKEMFLFNSALNTYLHLFGVRHMVTDHSNSMRENLLLPLQNKMLRYNDYALKLLLN